MKLSIEVSFISAFIMKQDTERHVRNGTNDIV